MSGHSCLRRSSGRSVLNYVCPQFPYIVAWLGAEALVTKSLRALVAGSWLFGVGGFLAAMMRYPAMTPQSLAHDIRETIRVNRCEPMGWWQLLTGCDSYPHLTPRFELALWLSGI